MTRGDLGAVKNRPLTRRAMLSGAAAFGAGLLLPHGAASASPAGSEAGNARQTLFGAFPGPWNYPNTDPYEHKAQMRARVCAAYGVATLPVERIFNEATWAVPPPRTPAIVSFTHDPSAVASGAYDAEIVAFVEALNSHTTYWLCLNHECDQSSRSYTPQEQVAGFRHFSRVVRSVGKPRVKLTTILMSWTLTQGADKWRQWYPGPSYVDALGWDAYWRPTLKHTAADVYGPAMAVTKAEGKPLLICETSMGAMGHGGQELIDGVYAEIPESLWTGFARDAIDLLDCPSTAAVCWFETHNSDGHWLLETHPEALKIWGAAVRASAA